MPRDTIGHGRLVRRLRRFLPYPLIGAALLYLQPVEPLGSDRLDLILDLCGLLVALTGEALRFWVWGANAEAGLMSLRASGPYALLRHPLYLGNFLIVVGMLLIFNNAVAYLLVIPTFVVLYNVIARKEEQQLLTQTSELSRAYQGYLRDHPNRFLPDLWRWRDALVPAHPFSWSVAVEKEYESVLGLLLGWVALDLLEEEIHWHGRSHGPAFLYFQLGLVVLLAIAAPLLWLRKKRRRAASAAGTG